MRAWKAISHAALLHLGMWRSFCKQLRRIQVPREGEEPDSASDPGEVTTPSDEER